MHSDERGDEERRQSGRWAGGDCTQLRKGEHNTVSIWRQQDCLNTEDTFVLQVGYSVESSL
jgi:hypothetical protein